MEVKHDEIWADIKGYEGHYQVSNWGRVRSLDRVDNLNRLWKGRVLKVKIIRGWLCANLSFHGVQDTISVARLVYLSFIGDLEDGELVSHKDKNYLNNQPDNLYKITRLDQMKRDVWPQNKSIKHYKSNLTKEKLLAIRGLIAKGYGDTKIAKMVGTTRPVVKHIRAGNTHKEKS